MPSIKARCLFSHALKLTKNEFVPQPRAFEREEIHQNARCTVIGLNPHTVKVRFDQAEINDIVSPEFLIPLELTKFGELVTKKSPELAQKLETLAKE